MKLAVAFLSITLAVIVISTIMLNLPPEYQIVLPVLALIATIVITRL